MSFLRKLFGGDQLKTSAETDRDGFFVYVQCGHCGARLRLRVHKQHDLNREDDGGFVWHKTIVDGRCFRPMPAVVRLDDAYQIVSAEIDGGRFMSQAEFEAEGKAEAAGKAEEAAEVSQLTDVDSAGS